jgi:hypothetical protein
MEQNVYKQLFHIRSQSSGEIMVTRTDIIQAQLEDDTILNIRATILGKQEDVAAINQLLSFSGVMKTMESVAEMLSKTIQKVKPQKASIEFGIEIAVESGQITALLVQGTGAGHLNIKLEWGNSGDG